ncbi:MAG: site-specific integrase [Candidatus Bathyarchaeota archaeon]|nr:site-specific integrase [Candidatus Bathyarchaeota archaeon]
MNTTEVFVDITGKQTLADGEHQRNLGGTTHIPGWSRTLTTQEYWKPSLVHTSEGYALVGMGGVDEERRTLKFVAEKGSNPRILSVSSDLIAMLKALPRRNEYIFSSTHGHANRGDYSKQLMLTRKSLARKLQNPRLLEITYHTLRHWKGTMEYHKTKDIIHVKTLLGHKNINNTMIYINLERAIFKETNDEFTVRATSDIDEACKLMEVGFEYACDMDGKKLFRKRK